MISRTPDELANEIRMNRKQFSGTFLIVEGRDDRLFMDQYISATTCKIEVANGKNNVCDVIDILDNDGFDGALGLIDADLDRICGTQHRSGNLVIPECHDLMTMLVCSPALDRTVREFGSRPKLEAFDEILLDALIDRALLIGYLRLFSKMEGLNLRFDGLNYSTWIDRLTFAPDTAKLIRAVKNHSQGHDLSSRTLEEGMRELYTAGLDPLEVCNGTDLVEILSIGLRKLLGNNSAQKVKPEALKASLRLAFSEQDFRLTGLKRDIEKWQDNTAGYQVMRSDLTR